MLVKPTTTFTFTFDADELAAVTTVLRENAEHTVFTDTAERVREILARINAGEPLTHGQADDLRVYVIRYLKARYSDDCFDWPPLLGGIALELQRRI